MDIRLNFEQCRFCETEILNEMPIVTLSGWEPREPGTRRRNRKSRTILIHWECWEGMAAIVKNHMDDEAKHHAETS